MEKEERCPLCRELLIIEDDDCIVNSQGLAFCLSCWTELAREARKEGIEPDDIVSAKVDDDLENIAVMVLNRKGAK